MFKVGLLILTTCFLSGSCKREKTLVQAHIIFRHGQRTPDPSLIYPKDPYKNEKYFPFGFGELNQKGKVEAYKLGQLLRTRYRSLIGPVYYQNEIEALSSSYNRAQMTLAIVLAGLYPPSDPYRIHDFLNWQPIISKTLEAKDDKLLNIYSRCNLNLHKDKEINKTTAELYSFLTYHTGRIIDGTYPLYSIYDTIKTEVENNLPIPEWVKPIWPEPMYSAAIVFWLDAIELNLSKSIGNLLEKIVADTKGIIGSNKKMKEKKMVLYSGHDMNNVFLLAAFNSYKNEPPRYLSNFALEVHFIDETYGFKLFYQNGLDADLIQIPVPGCGNFCPLRKFEAYVTKHFSPGKCV